jgi:general stress protein CsbA
MEGYGRWVALIIFSVLFAMAVYHDYKKDKWSIIYPSLLMLGVSIIVFILIIIVKYW